jgi:hypothetical protein
MHFIRADAGAPARSLLTMRVASASDSTSSAMMSSGFCVFSTPSRIGMSGASLRQKRVMLSVGFSV